MSKENILHPDMPLTKTTSPWRETSCALNAFDFLDFRQSKIPLLGLFEVLMCNQSEQRGLARARENPPELTYEQDTTNPLFSSVQSHIPTHLHEQKPPEQPMPGEPSPGNRTITFSQCTLGEL